MSWGEGGPACLWKEQQRLGRVLQGLQDGRWGEHGLRESFTGHAVCSQPEARSAGAQEAAHGVMAGMVTDAPLQRPPAFVYIYTGVLVAMQMEASSTGTPVAANAVFTSLLTGGPEAFIRVLAAVAVGGELHAGSTLAHKPAFRVHAVALARGAQTFVNI